MNRYIALLRGINVSGHNAIRMTALQTSFTTLGLQEPQTYLQVNTSELTGWLDDYIWTQLFGGAFNPLESQHGEEHWRLLLLQPVVDHITKVFAMALLESEQQHVTGQTEVRWRHLSEVPRLMVRESHSVAVAKCIYTRLAWPARNGGLERTFIHWAQADSQIEAFCKLSELLHFARLQTLAVPSRQTRLL